MTPVVRQHGSRPAGILARSAGCLGVLVLAGVLSAVGVVAWFLVEVHHTRQTRSHDAKAAVAASAEHLRARLGDADSDGVLTDQEIDAALGHRHPRSLVRGPARTVLVVQIAASDWAQCYAYTALPSGAVSSKPLEECPPAPSSSRAPLTPRGPTAARAPA
ncbi:hypothetical protein [Streptomyces sp. NBC_00557]|uniref:hypothetical protein n=1 Tax=Streptomyces sp. NBC_00557 TaxID=2975776 RepID=UPI002E7FDB72|nr:hypothetical protein [Streptomyces sp. NBC_00557]WUC37431.1 hypothetical protein OG956_26055 [Streptomyces sp. NBC_00557]